MSFVKRFECPLFGGTTVASYMIAFSPIVTNVGIGIAIFSQELSIFVGSLTIFYVYLAWLIFFLAVIAALFMLFTILSCTSQDEGKGWTLDFASLCLSYAA